MRILQEWNSKQGCILCEDVMRDREGVTMDKRTKVKTRSHTPLLFLFVYLHFPNERTTKLVSLGLSKNLEHRSELQIGERD